MIVFEAPMYGKVRFIMTITTLFSCFVFGANDTFSCWIILLLSWRSWDQKMLFQSSWISVMTSVMRELHRSILNVLNKERLLWLRNKTKQKSWNCFFNEMESDFGCPLDTFSDKRMRSKHLRALMVALHWFYNWIQPTCCLDEWSK